MERIGIQIQKLAHASDLPLPDYATEQSAGVDLLAAISQPMVIKPQEILLIPTGLKIALPAGFEAQVRPRSGLALKNGLTIPNSPGTIDADYRGEIQVILMNASNTPFEITRGMRIAQLVFARYARGEFKEVEELNTSTERGEGGFGSTGV